MKVIEAFFRDLDAQWQGKSDSRIRLPVIGSAALLLQTDYARGTKDSAVLRTRSLVLAVERQLIALAGRDSRLYARHRIYIDIVPDGLPLLAQTPVWRRLVDLSAALERPERQNLNHIEENDYGVEPTTTELPDWLDD